MGPRIIITIDAEDMSAREFRRVISQLGRTNRALRNTGREADRTRRSFEGLSEGITAGRAIIGGMIRALAGLVGSLTTAAGEIEGYTIAFGALTGSTRTAGEEIDKLRQERDCQVLIFNKLFKAK